MTSAALVNAAEVFADGDWPLVRAYIRRGCERATELDPSISPEQHAALAADRAQKAGDTGSAVLFRAAFANHQEVPCA